MKIDPGEQRGGLAEQSALGRQGRILGNHIAAGGPQIVAAARDEGKAGVAGRELLQCCMIARAVGFIRVQGGHLRAGGLKTATFGQSTPHRQKDEPLPCGPPVGRQAFAPAGGGWIYRARVKDRAGDIETPAFVGVFQPPERVMTGPPQA